MKGKSTEFTLLILVIVLVAGLYLVMNNINTLQEQVSNLELNLELLSGELRKTPETVAPTKNGDETTPPSSIGETTDGVVIPTAILFQTDSSPLLTPQTVITVELEKVSKTEEGVVTLFIKAFTNRAGSYSTLDPGTLFELLNFESANQKALKVRGDFSSMQPQSSVEGELIFKIEPAQTTAIFQLNTKEGIKYYEINFATRTYREAVLG